MQVGGLLGNPVALVPEGGVQPASEHSQPSHGHEGHRTAPMLMDSPLCRPAHRTATPTIRTCAITHGRVGAACASSLLAPQVGLPSTCVWGESSECKGRACIRRRCLLIACNALDLPFLRLSPFRDQSSFDGFAGCPLVRCSRASESIICDQSPYFDA
jgi:hypothetical protein